MKQIAIIGSGPAGCYLVDQLLRVEVDTCIDVIDRSPVPFGLVRYGVAPDHQGTKAITRLLDRALAREHVHFFGNVEVGCDVQLAELCELYDAIVLATGAPLDRSIGLPGQALPGVVGSARFVGWYNSRPGYAAPPARDARAAVVIGNGNVALDVARVLAKGPDELVGSDLSPTVSAQLRSQPLESVHIVGRRGPADAKFAAAELAEFGRLAHARPRLAEPQWLDGLQPEGEHARVVGLLRGFEENHAAAGEGNIDIVFHFGATPAAFEGNGQLEAVRFSRPERDPLVLPAQLAVTCIGYESVDCSTLATTRGIFANQDAFIDDGLYVIGWAARGPSGTIPTNRSEAQRVARRLAAETTDHGRGGSAALTLLLQRRGVRVVDHAGWLRIDAAERTRADTQRCRYKFETIEEMVATAGL